MARIKQNSIIVKIKIQYILLLLFICAFFPLLKVGYTTNDETHIYYLLKFTFSDIFHEIVNCIKLTFYYFQGSFRPNISNFISSLFLSFFCQSYLSLKLMRCLAIFLHALNIYLFYAIVKSVFKSKISGSIAVLLFVVFIQNSWQHNLLVSYYISLLIYCFYLFSVLLFIKYLKNYNEKTLIFSAIFFFLSLSYEPIIIYFPLFFFMAVYYFYKKNSDILLSAKKSIKPFLYITTGVILFVSIYIYIRFFVNADIQVTFESLGYEKSEGNLGYSISFGMEKIKQIVKVIYQFGISAFPTYIYHHSSEFLDSYSQAYLGHRNNLIHILRSSQLIWLVKSMIAGFALFYLLTKQSASKIELKKYLLGVVVSIYLIFAPGIPVSLVTKYQNWVEMGCMGFINTYYSFFGVIILFTLSLNYISSLFINANFNRYIKYFQTGIYILIAFFVSLISVVTDYSNNAYTTSQIQSTYKWKTFDAFLKSVEFKNLPENSIIYAPSLFQFIGIMEIFPPYWTHYAAYKTEETINILHHPELIKSYVKDSRVIFKINKSKNIQIVGKQSILREKLQKADKNRLYFLKYSQEKKDSNQFIVFGKINSLVDKGADYDFLSDKADIYTISKYRKFLLFGCVYNEAFNKKLKIDGKDILEYHGNFFSYVTNKDHEKNVPIQTTVQTTDMYLNSISISNYSDFKFISKRVEINFGEGAFQDEITHRWFDSESSMFITNKTKNDKLIEITMNIATGHGEKSNFLIHGQDFSDRLVINNFGYDYQKKLIIKKESYYKLILSSDAKRVDAPNDPRHLVFAIKNIKINYEKDI